MDIRQANRTVHEGVLARPNAGAEQVAHDTGTRHPLNSRRGRGSFVA